MASVIELKNNDFDPSTYPVYFLDSNIWIAILKSNHSENTEKRFSHYLNLFEAIIQLNSITDPFLLKKTKVIPKIAFTSMLMSEIINTYLRVVAMPTFLNGAVGNFKKDYRENIYSDYDKQLKMLIDDIEAYSFAFSFFDDSFNDLGPIPMLKSLSRTVDYNDLYYMALMGKNKIAIVTDDKDFNSDSVNVITSNKNLLKKN